MSNGRDPGDELGRWRKETLTSDVVDLREDVVSRICRQWVLAG